MEYSRIPKNGFQRRTIKVDYYYYHRGQIHTKCNSIRVIKRESENYDTHTKRVRRQTDRQRQRHRERFSASNSKHLFTTSVLQLWTLGV